MSPDVLMTAQSYDGNFGQDLAYDLRQRYAKIVGDHLEDITEARKNNDYSHYFKALEDLYTITRHKFKKKKDKEEKKKGYKKLRQNAINISNNYSDAWSGNSTDPEDIAKIEEALRAMEEWLYLKMDEANMFGSKRDTEGLI